MTLSIGDTCHENGVFFILAQNYGVFSRIFCDFGDKFVVHDTNGENPKMLLVSSISNEPQAVISVPDDERHNLETGDFVTFADIQGLEELNGGKEYQVKSLSNCKSPMSV